MYLLLACSLFVGYIGIERAIFYGDMDAGKAFAEQFYTQMKLRLRPGPALGHGRPRRPAPHFAGCLSASGPDVKAFVEMQSGIFVAKLRRRLYYLSVIVTMAPLLGLLGTISGMIRSFSILNVQSGQAVAITGGVGEALIATDFGLCVAILALAVHSYFTQRLDRIITDMEMCFSALETMPVKAGQ